MVFDICSVWHCGKENEIGENDIIGIKGTKVNGFLTNTVG